jgi:hypothetical protein
MARRRNDGNVRRRGSTRVERGRKKERDRKKPKPKATAPNTPPAYPMQPGQNPPFYVGPGDNPEFQFGPTPPAPATPRPKPGGGNDSRVKRPGRGGGNPGMTPGPQVGQPRRRGPEGDVRMGGGGGQRMGAGEIFRQGGREGLMDAIYGRFGGDYSPRGVQPGGPMGHLWADPRGSNSLASVISQGRGYGQLQSSQAGQQFGQPRPSPRRPGRFTASGDD